MSTAPYATHISTTAPSAGNWTNTLQPTTIVRTYVPPEVQQTASSAATRSAIQPEHLAGIIIVGCVATVILVTTSILYLVRRNHKPRHYRPIISPGTWTPSTFKSPDVISPQTAGPALCARPQPIAAQPTPANATQNASRMIAERNQPSASPIEPTATHRQEYTELGSGTQHRRLEELPPLHSAWSITSSEWSIDDHVRLSNVVGLGIFEFPVHERKSEAGQVIETRSSSSLQSRSLRHSNSWELLTLDGLENTKVTSLRDWAQFLREGFS